MTGFKEVELSDIFDFPPINGVNEGFIYKNKGKIPVYGGRKDGKSKGGIRDNIHGVKYFENCLSWNRNGSVGYVFIRNEKFTTTDDHRPLYIKEKLKNVLSMSFLRFQLQNSIFANGFAWDNKAGKEKLKLLSISIPVTPNGTFDLEKQIEIANRYERIEQFKRRIEKYYSILKNCIVSIEKDTNIQYKKVELESIFDFVKGNSKYTHKYFLNNFGNFPVYSSATRNNGVIANIDSFDFDTENDIWLSWTTDGIYAGTVFLRNGKFSMTTHCGLLKLKENSSKEIDRVYLKLLLNDILPNNAIGDQNKRVTIDIISKVSIPIPIKEDGSFDLEKQKEIANRYERIGYKKSKTMEYLKQILNTQVRIEDNEVK